jgi:hypothetical protein
VLSPVYASNHRLTQHDWRKLLTMKRKVALIAALLTASVMAAAQNTAKTNETFVLRIPHVLTTSGERIVGFEIELTSGMVQSVSNLPIGWYVQVNNDASWNTTIKGNVSVGAAALEPDELRQVRITVQKDTTKNENPFAVSGTVAVTTDFEKTRNILLVAADFEVLAVK